MAYTGRVGTIVTDVLRLFNDRAGKFTLEADVLAWINSLYRELAADGLWEMSKAINTTANTGYYDLSTVTFTEDTNATVAQLDKLYWIYNGANSKQIEVFSRERFEEALSVYPTGETVRGYYQKGTLIYFVPVPTSSLTSAMRGYFTVARTALTGATPNDNPKTFATYDDYFVYGCLEKAVEMDKSITRWQEMIQEFKAKKEAWRYKLLEAHNPQKIVLRNYR